MPQQPIRSVENNFTKGLVTEFTGLNFPENAATETENCIYTIVGDVTRREGIDEELNGSSIVVDRTGLAMSSYVWNNPGGDGNSKLFVKQIGHNLYFWNIATSTVSDPLSTQFISTLVITVGSGMTFDVTKECTFADGNGFLFVYHPSCDTNYVTFDPVTLAFTIAPINIQIRDFIGVIDNLGVNIRPTTLSTPHNYNIQNQGWTTANPWWLNDTTTTYAIPLGVGSHIFTTTTTGTSITPGTLTQIVSYDATGTDIGFGIGTVTSYSGSTLTLNLISYTAFNPSVLATVSVFTPAGTGFISSWFSAEGNFPSNADVWWYFKDDTGVFNPATMAGEVTLATGQAPQGHFLLSAFNQDRASAATLTGIPTVTTGMRPSNGAWFQGRVWYTGVSASQPATAFNNFYTWSENIYFSQIVSTSSDFGTCFQTNDPTSENLNSLLPSDGGVITIVGCGTIHKLFSTQNGLLVFANNGIWYITGSQGIGFAADDFTITKISSVKVLSNKSFVDVLGLPLFWNEEGIYQVAVSQNGSLAVEPLTVSTILSFYNEIPLSSKQYARGDYDPINYVIQWCYRSTPETSVTDRYQYDSILNFNTYNKAFFPYSLGTTGIDQFIHDVKYVSYPFIDNQTPDASFKYPFSELSGSSYNISFAEEFDDNYLDWGNVNYVSNFTTGYKLHGQGMRDFEIPYIFVYSRLGQPVAYYIQSIWNYANTGNSGRWSTKQRVNIFNPNFDNMMRRHRLRGRGKILQFKVTSVDGMPFDIMGWATYEMQNTGV